MQSHQHPWTPEEDATLGIASDREIAARLGRTPGAVKARRFALGVRPRRTTAVADSFAARLGRQIAQARQAAGLTQAQAAQKAGVAARLWRKYEAGNVEPSVSRFLAIAKAVDASLDSLLPSR